LGLNWLDQIAQAEVRGEALSGTRQYDAAMMVYYEGGPSQADSFDRFFHVFSGMTTWRGV
jgi:hypothetical protein